jgi:hypothetical protein
MSDATSYIVGGNPWINLPNEAPFVLPCDEMQVAEFNQSSRPNHRLHLDIVPEREFTK